MKLAWNPDLPLDIGEKPKRIVGGFAQTRPFKVQAGVSMAKTKANVVRKIAESQLDNSFHDLSQNTRDRASRQASFVNGSAATVLRSSSRAITISSST